MNSLTRPLGKLTLEPMKSKICPHCEGTGRIVDPVDFGAEMRKERLKTGASLRSVAAKLGFSPSYLSDLERGRRNWSQDRLDRFLTCLKNDKKD